jgi:WD40 repeat protein
MDTKTAPLPPGVPGPVALEVPAHQLLHNIDEGGYGKIWLAKNVMGTYRAVKVVYRHTFKEARPYEREFDGIKKFEPISRSHDGLVDILQVERNDAAGYFYYVMELADDKEAGQQIDPSSYSPKTLSSERIRQGRLPVAECIKVGLSLSAALSHLHRHGLVHRDIKPANIVFVNGVAKIADIGLVTAAGGECSCVGTPGFIPPEGPGQPPADIYALGKVLYEVSTGNDRLDFPDLPEAILQSPDGPALVELSEVFNKASAARVQQRYQSADELHAHLSLLQAGKSVRRILEMERLLNWVKRYGPALLGVLVVLAVVVFQIYRDIQRSDEQRQRQVGSYLAYGSRTLADGDLLGALPWFVQALQLDRKDPLREETHRVRVASVLQQAPTLVQMWFHTNRMTYAEFGTNADQVLSSGADGRIALWDVRTGQRLSPLYGTGKNEEEKATFSRDHQRVLTAYSDHIIRVWDAATGNLVRSWPHTAWILSAKFSPDGQHIVTTGNDDPRVIVWDSLTGEKLLRMTNHTGTVLYADFSPDGRRIVSVGTDGRVNLWDAATGKLLWMLRGHTKWVYYAAFSPDSQRVATAGQDRTVRVWDVATGDEVFFPLEHDDGVASVEFSPDGQFLVSACWDGTVQIWDSGTGKRTNTPLHHSGRLMHAAFSPDGRRVLTVCYDGTVRVWQLRPPAPAVERAPTVFSPDGSRLAHLAGDHIELREAGNSNLLSSVAVNAPALTRMLLNRDGQFLLTLTVASPDPAHTNWEAQLWDTATGQPSGPRIPLDAGLPELALSGDGRHLAVFRNEAVVLDTRVGTRLLALGADKNSVKKIAFDSAGERMAVARGSTVQTWDLASKRPILPAGLAHGKQVTHLEFSPDDSLLVTACSDSTFDACAAQLWNARTGARVGGPMAHNDGVLYAAFSPQGDRVLTCSEDATAIVWETRTGRALPFPPLRHRDQVIHGAFSRNGRWIVTTDRTGEARVWDAATGEPLTPPLAPSSPGLRSARFVAGDQRIAGQGTAGKTWLWELPRDPHSVEDLWLLAQLLASQPGRYIGEAGPPAREQLRQNWKQWRAKSPSSISNSTQ